MNQDEPTCQRCYNTFMKNLLAIFFVIACVGCSSMSSPIPNDGGKFRQHNEGYSLLYKLVSDDGDVDKIFILKHADDSVKALIKEIAAYMQSARKQMDEFRKSDRGLDYGVSDLPAIEQRSRDLQAGDERSALLFSGGETFELRLIFTQTEAMNYATQLAKSLAEREDDPNRKKFLDDVAKRCGAFHERLMNLLSVKAGAA